MGTSKYHQWNQLEILAVPKREFTVSNPMDAGGVSEK